MLAFYICQGLGFLVLSQDPSYDVAGQKENEHAGCIAHDDEQQWQQNARIETIDRNYR